MDDARTRHAHLPLLIDERATWMQAAISVGMAGFLALMAQVSFPVPWTPVPFSLMPFALLIAGAYQRPAWAALSVLLYLAAGAAGLPVFAEGSSGWRHLIGNTAGYLFGFVVVSAFVSWYMQERRTLIQPKWLILVGTALGLAVLGGIVAVIRFSGTGSGFDAYGERYAGWSYGTSLLWVFLFLTVAGAGVTVWSLLRSRGRTVEALNLFLVFLASIGILHVLGVSGLVLIGGLDVVTAIILGSVVFLPFDLVKAGLAVGLSLPFVPENPHA